MKSKKVKNILARINAAAKREESREEGPGRQRKPKAPKPVKGAPPPRPASGKPHLTLVRPHDADGKPLALRGPKTIPYRQAARQARARAGQAKPEIDEGLVRKLFAAAQPMAGVVPDSGPTLAMDEAIQASVDATVALAMASGWTEGMFFLGYPYLSELALRVEYRKLGERLATEMTRKWIKFTTAGREDLEDEVKQVEKWFSRMKVRECFHETAQQDAWFGRSHLFLEVGAEDDRTEQETSIGGGDDVVSKSKVSPNTPVQRLRVVEPMWCYPATYNATDPLRADWYKPEQWFVMGKKVHSSRLLPFVGREVPDILKAAYAFGGLSLSQLAKPYVDNWLRTRDSVSRLVSNFSKNGLKTNMAQRLMPSDGSSDVVNVGSPNAGAGEDLFARVDFYNATSDNQGMMVIDKDTEEFFQYNTPLGTLDALQAQAIEQIAFVNNMPIVVMLGQTPKGLNSSAEGEIRIWYDWVKAYQRLFWGENLRRVLCFAQLSLWGKVIPEIGFEFESLWEMDEKQRADVNKTKSDEDVALINAGVVDPLESRRRLAADPNSGYSNINVDDVPDAPDDDDAGDDMAARGDDPPDAGAAEVDPEGDQ